jgi:hypothetical protein
MRDFGTTRYCKKCGLEIINKGDCVTMTADSKFCECNNTHLNNEPGDKKQDSCSLVKDNSPASPFVLKEQQNKLYGELCDTYPDVLWGYVFEKIFDLDKEFIQLLLGSINLETGQFDAENLYWLNTKIKSLAGDLGK